MKAANDFFVLMDFLRWYSDNCFLGTLFLLIIAVVTVSVTEILTRWLMVMARGYPPCSCIFEEEEKKDGSDENAE